MADTDAEDIQLFARDAVIVNMQQDMIGKLAAGHGPEELFGSKTVTMALAELLRMSIEGGEHMQAALRALTGNSNFNPDDAKELVKKYSEVEFNDIDVIPSNDSCH